MSSSTVMRKATRMVISAVLVIAFLVGCSAKSKTLEPKPADGFPVTIQDSYGRKVVVPKKPARIVSLVPSHTEILFALGLDSSIVGVTKYCDYPEAAQRKEQVGGFSNPSVEKIVSLKPDLVLAGDLHKAVVEQLEKMNIPVLAMSARTVAEVPEIILTIGQATGSREKAQEIHSGMKRRIEAVVSRTKGLGESARPRVYYELWHDPPTTVGPGSFLHDLIVLAGGSNIASDAKSAYPKISVETIIQRNPQLILYAHAKQRADEITRRPGWAGVEAVKTGKIVLFKDENIFMRAGPRIVDALELLARTVHPEIFK